MNASTMPPRAAIAAGILAGGAGRRFGGRDKGWLELGGQPLVRRLADALRPQADVLLISANRNLERYRTLGDRVVADAGGDFAGPMAGLQALWSASTHPYLVLAPVDALQLPADYVARLVQALVRADADIAVASVAGDWHYPCCALRRERLSTPPGHGSLRGWMAPHRLIAVPMPAGSILSVNSAGEWRGIERRLASGADA